MIHIIYSIVILGFMFAALVKHDKHRKLLAANAAMAQALRAYNAAMIQATKDAPAKLYGLSPALPEMILQLIPWVKIAEKFDSATSKTYKRDWVYGQYLKAHPGVSQRDLSKAIEFALDEVEREANEQGK